MIQYIDRKTGNIEKEEVYYEGILRFFYGNSLHSRIFGRCFLEVFKWPVISWFFGTLQKSRASAKRIVPFIRKYKLDVSEFELPPEKFTSFNDFFIRKLKPESRPLILDKNVACIPADGRYSFYTGVGVSDIFSIKGESLFFEELFQSRQDAKLYHNGSMVLARLCPTDCHRFYFPFDCIPLKSTLFNGKLYSVNPIATHKMPWIFYRNRRWLTFLKSDVFGDVAYIEVGATMVGSVIHTNTPNVLSKKGEEKGYFSFGGSAIIMLFKQNTINFSQDLLEATKRGLEIRCLIGQEMGTSSKK